MPSGSGFRARNIVLKRAEIEACKSAANGKRAARILHRLGEELWE
jgi:hypothetical protein